MKLRDELRDQWGRVLVLNCHGVECLVVLDQMEEAVLFLDKEYQSYYKGLRWPNASSPQVLL